MVICAPSGITEVERRAVEEATLSAGAREVHLIEESLAAAIGAGIDIGEPVGRMVVDIGGGTSEVAVISLGGLVVASSLRVGGYDLDDAITNHIRLEHRMAIGSQSAEAIKLAAGLRDPARARRSRRRSAGATSPPGLPREIVLTSEEVRQAIASPLAEIMTAIHATLEETPPELAADITTEGVLLAGGGSLLRGLRPARGRRDRHAGAARRRPAGLRRHRRRHVARGTRHAPARSPSPHGLRPGLYTPRTGTGGREAEGTRLLSEYGVYSSIAGSNPALSVTVVPAR